MHAIFLAEGTPPPATDGGPVTIALPIILLILAALLLANSKAPRFAGLLLFIAGVGLSGTAMAGSLTSMAQSMVTGLIQAIEDGINA